MKTTALESIILLGIKDYTQKYSTPVKDVMEKIAPNIKKQIENRVISDKTSFAMWKKFTLPKKFANHIDIKFKQPTLFDISKTSNPRKYRIFWDSLVTYSKQHKREKN